jgi:hypothetical protein
VKPANSAKDQSPTPGSRFPFWVFRIAGIYGIIVLLPQYFLETQTGFDFPPPINHPEYYYGFIGVALAWQVVFLIISADPQRHRTLMLAGVLEKYSYGIAMLILFSMARIPVAVLITALIDLTLGTLFILAYMKTGESL